MTQRATSPDGLELPADLAAKWQRLLEIITQSRSILVAFSGGVDSSLLLAAAKQALGQGVQAAICLGEFTPSWEAERARELAAKLGVRLHEADVNEMGDARVARNDHERCYYCKQLRFERLVALAAELGLSQVAEGSQIDDEQDFRPGNRARDEMGITSPLAQAGLGKQEVRALSRALGLATADIPAAACLASRVPWGVPLSAETLQRIGRAEQGLRRLFKGNLRVRDHFPLARLELNDADLARCMEGPLRQEVNRLLLEAGYQYATIDLAGYRMGGGQQTPGP